MEAWKGRGLPSLFVSAIKTVNSNHILNESTVSSSVNIHDSLSDDSSEFFPLALPKER